MLTTGVLKLHRLLTKPGFMPWLCQQSVLFYGDPTGILTRVTAVKGPIEVPHPSSLSPVRDQGPQMFPFPMSLPSTSLHRNNHMDQTTLVRRYGGIKVQFMIG